MAGGDGFEGGPEVGVGVDLIHFRRFNETGDAGPGRSMEWSEQQSVYTERLPRPFRGRS